MVTYNLIRDTIGRWKGPSISKQLPCLFKFVIWGCSKGSMESNAKGEAEKHVLQVYEVHNHNKFQFVSLDPHSISQEFAGGAERGEGLAPGLTCWRKGYEKSPDWRQPRPNWVCRREMSTAKRSVVSDFKHERQNGTRPRAKSWPKLWGAESHDEAAGNERRSGDIQQIQEDQKIQERNANIFLPSQAHKNVWNIGYNRWNPQPLNAIDGRTKHAPLLYPYVHVPLVCPSAMRSWWDGSLVELHAKGWHKEQSLNTFLNFWHNLIGRDVLNCPYCPVTAFWRVILCIASSPVPIQLFQCRLRLANNSDIIIGTISAAHPWPNRISNTFRSIVDPLSLPHGRKGHPVGPSWCKLCGRNIGFCCDPWHAWLLGISWCCLRLVHFHVRLSFLDTFFMLWLRGFLRQFLYDFAWWWSCRDCILFWFQSISPWGFIDHALSSNLNHAFAWSAILLIYIYTGPAGLPAVWVDIYDYGLTRPIIYDTSFI